MKHVFIGIILGLAAGASFASGNNNQNNSGGDSNATATASATGGSVGAINVNGGSHTATATGGNATAIGGAGGKAEANSVNVNSNKAEQSQGQKQGQVQGQGQSQAAIAKQSQSANNAGNKQSTTITFEDKRQAPGVAVAGTTTTASCMVAVYGGVSFPGGSVAGGSAYKDTACDDRALGLAMIDSARVAGGLGANPEYVAMLFMRGVELLERSERKVEETGAKKTIGSQTGATEQLNP